MPLPSLQSRFIKTGYYKLAKYRGRGHYAVVRVELAPDRSNCDPDVPSTWVPPYYGHYLAAIQMGTEDILRLFDRTDLGLAAISEFEDYPVDTTPGDCWLAAAMATLDALAFTDRVEAIEYDHPSRQWRIRMDHGCAFYQERRRSK